MSKTNPSPHMGLSTTNGRASVVDIGRQCAGEDISGTCAERDTCVRYQAGRPTAIDALRLPRVAGCACHYRIEVAR